MKKKQLKTVAYEYLLDQIVFCNLVPGTVILEEEIAAAIGSSRTPVHEAVLELEKDGYITISPRKSTFVSKISLRDIDEITRIRYMLEPQVLREYCPKLTGEDRERIIELRNSILDWQSRHERGEPIDKEQFLRTDYKMHMTLTGLAGNQHLSSYMSTLLLKSVRFWYMLLYSTGTRFAETCEEHLELLDAVRERDGEKAASQMERHIIVTQERSYIIG